ncbi:MAG: thrombospondin [Polyangiaceae bacterium]|nr:thrombospondin [Polyangiaceae bacterium]
MRRRAALLAASVLALSGHARADGCEPHNRLSTCVDSDTLWPRAGSGTFAQVGGATLLPPARLGFGVVTAYQKRPIVLTLPSTDPRGSEAAAIDDQLNATFLFSAGVLPRLQLDAAVPFTLWQTGVGDSPLKEQQPGAIARSVPRDPRVGLTAGILPRPATTREGLAVVARADVVLPFGDERLYAGQSGFGFAPSVAGEWRRGRWLVGLDLGLRARRTTELSGTRVGSQLVEAIGAAFDVLPDERLAVTAEAFALQGLAKQSVVVRDGAGALVDGGSRASHMPASVLIGARSSPAFAGDLSFSLSAGTALPLSDNDATSPRLRVVGAMRYAPLGRDRDGDGVLDRDDRCPEQPEDKDGFQDDDGCPDPDNDGDGIPDARDRCRDAPEDKDGSEDDDGCPDPDDDGDGVLDADDQCRGEPEDKDGFRDEDGCPDPDNDGDGVPDKDDKCPNGPEDMDGFRDEDGCPDPDNDLDGIADELDKCPNEAEDKDGFEDDDGCPEPDNDLDGVPDKQDKCPQEPETIDGVDDDDGCPEPGGKQLVSVEKGKIVSSVKLMFRAGQAKLTPELERGLRMAAQRARGTRELGSVIVETFGDPGAPPARAEKLALDRAEAVRAVLIKLIDPELLTVAAGDVGQRRAPGAAHVEITVAARRPKKPQKATK